jgi:hypothetical protein
MGGGTIITLTGHGFSPTAAENVVLIADALCEVRSATNTKLMCSTPAVVTAESTLGTPL